MKKLLLSLMVIGLLATTRAQAYAYPPIFVEPANNRYIAGTSRTKTSTNVLKCWFQTTGDNIPVQMEWTNFLVNGAHSVTFTVKYPGAVYMIFKGVVPIPGREIYAYLYNKDYDGAYAKSLVLVSCWFNSQ